jgi:transmembrane sensor
MDGSSWKDKRLRRVAVAAAITALLGIGIWWLTRLRSVPSIEQTAKAGDIPAPVRTRAFLTLAGGQRIDIYSAANGALAREGGVGIIKGSHGQISYQTDIQHSRELLYHTLNNPLGSTVMDITLSDGTRVWLNCGSSIRYPVIFPAYDRTVEITGEAYFEVASDASRPFGVKKHSVLVRALGTSFNIKAYDEPLLRVTLIEGEAKVTADKTLTLEVGQQAVVKENLELINNINPDAVMAWKNGLFFFSHTDMISVMRELSRWYDVHVIYEKDIPSRYFTGKLDRTLTLEQVLKALTDDRVHYTIDPGTRRLRIGL